MEVKNLSNRTIRLLLKIKFAQALAVIGAIYLATNNLDGWGWFLFVALLLKD